jgi:hypothetical protein
LALAADGKVHETEDLLLIQCTESPPCAQQQQPPEQQLELLDKELSLADLSPRGETAAEEDPSHLMGPDDQDNDGFSDDESYGEEGSVDGSYDEGSDDE